MNTGDKAFAREKAFAATYERIAYELADWLIQVPEAPAGLTPKKLNDFFLLNAREEMDRLYGLDSILSQRIAEQAAEFAAVQHAIRLERSLLGRRKPKGEQLADWLCRRVAASPAAPKYKLGVRQTAVELCEKLAAGVKAKEYKFPKIYLWDHLIMNGNDTWKDYVEAGETLIYNEDIAERFLTKAQRKHLPKDADGFHGMTWLEIMEAGCLDAMILINNHIEFK
ncbi:MAG: hypothetical protein NC080_07290 [Paraprevotella sp.]|nr:hypothetical protein [Paraprevotella sp.]